MVLVDTSVWISIFRKEKTDIGQKLWALVAANEAALCGQVLVEYLGGFRKSEDRQKHLKSLRAFPFLEADRATFEKAAELLGSYPRLGAGDAIIAATALVTRSALLTLDKDFLALKSEGLHLY